MVSASIHDQILTIALINQSMLIIDSSAPFPGQIIFQSFRLPDSLKRIFGNILNPLIICFSATEYGRLINQAVGYRYDGDETKAVEVWNEVLKLDSNFELANTGIGKAYLTSGENKTAMNYLEIGMSRDYYSVAWKRYRNEYLKENLGYILTGIIGLIIAIILLKKFVLKKNAKKRKRERR